MSALSFSRLDVYLQCPKQFEAKFISKTYPDESTNPALVKGQEIHKQLENYTLFKLGKLNDEPKLTSAAKNATKIIDKITTSYQVVQPELELAINDKWERCGWFDSDVYYRAKIDLIAHNNGDELTVIDHKTGKVRHYEEGPYAQLNLTSAMLFSVMPEVNKINCAYLFVEHKVTSKVEFTRDKYKVLKAPFDLVHKMVNSDTKFEPTPNKYCRFCKVNDCPYKD